MTTAIMTDASGTYGALQVNGADAVTFDATGIKAGSYKAGSIVAADFGITDEQLDTMFVYGSKVQ